MATNLFQNNSASIYGSRETIRNTLALALQDYLELSKVDLQKTEFLSYILNMESVLTANLMYYTANIYKEFFFTEAQMPDSVINLGKWIAYYPKSSEASTVDVLFVIPIDKLPDNTQISVQIPQNYKILADKIPFTLNAGDKAIIQLDTSMTKQELTKYSTSNIKVYMASKDSLTVSDSTGKYYPVQLNTVNNSLMFMLPFAQEEILFETFNIPYNLEFYQFYSKLLSFPEQQISRIRVFIKRKIIEGETLPSTYDQFVLKMPEYEEWTISESGLYTMTDEDKKFIWTSTYGTGEVFFGNGVIGVQPTRGTHVVVLLYTSYGTNGNIIPNTINSWEPLYYQYGDNSNLKTYQFPVVLSNPNSSEGGKDIQSLNEIKSEAIAGLRSRHRLVSDIDYNDANEIIPYLPISHTKPVLKRSDLKINEIMMFNSLYYQDPAGIQEIVPTRNIIFQWPVDSSGIYPVDHTGSIENPLYIPAGANSWHDDDNINFETIFNMTIDPTSLTAKYEYIVEQLAAAANLEINNFMDFYSSMNIISVLFTKVLKDDPLYPSIYMFVQTAVEPDDYQNYELRIVTKWNEKNYASKAGMIENDLIEIEKIYENGKFTGFGIEFPYINEFPLDESDFTIEFWGLLKTEKDPHHLYPNLIILKTFSCTAIIRYNMQPITFSYVKEDINSLGERVYKIYDTPVILTQYLNQDYFQRGKFDTYVLQKYINNTDLTSNRMLTDFTNVKFCDTWGQLFNMKYNSTSKTVLSMSLLAPPLPSDLHPNDLFIVNGGEGIDYFGNNWLQHIHQYALWNVDHWDFIQPKIGDFILIDNKYNPETEPNQGKKFIYTGKFWMEPIFNIPLILSLKIVRDNSVNINDSGIIQSIKDTLFEYYTPKFGLDVNIDRSEIVRVVRGVAGVLYAELLKPEVDLRFEFDVDDMLYEDLIKYTPQLVMFTKDSIAVTFAN